MAKRFFSQNLVCRIFFLLCNILFFCCFLFFCCADFYYYYYSICTARIFFPTSACRNLPFQNHPPTPSKVKWSACAVTLIRTVQLSGCSESLDSMTADAFLLIFSPLQPTYEKSKELQISTSIYDLRAT